MIETRFKDTEIGRIPEDWEVKPLADLGTFSKGAGISRAEALSGNIPAIRYGEIYTCHNDYIKTFHSFISQNVADTSAPIFYGDILFAASGETKEEIGKSVAYTDNKTAYAGGDIIILHSDTEKFDAKFCGYASNAKYVVKQKSQRGQGDAVVHVVPRDIASILLTFPPSITEQTRIATALSNVDSLISELGKLIEKKRAIKQGAMQQLLTGKKRLKGFEDIWVEKKLGEIAPLQRGFDLPTHEIRNGNIPVVYSNGVCAYHNIGKCMAPGLVTGRSGTIGKFTFISSGEYWPHNTSLWVTSFYNNEPLLIYYLYSPPVLPSCPPSGIRPHPSLRSDLPVMP